MDQRDARVCAFGFVSYVQLLEDGGELTGMFCTPPSAPRYFVLSATCATSSRVPASTKLLDLGQVGGIRILPHGLLLEVVVHEGAEEAKVCILHVVPGLPKPTQLGKPRLRQRLRHPVVLRHVALPVGLSASCPPPTSANERKSP